MSDSRSHRCPVCNNLVTIPETGKLDEYAEVDAANDRSAGEIRCGRCQCVLPLDSGGELMVRVSRTSARRLAAELAGWHEGGERRKLFLDFEDLEFLDSEFLNELICLHRGQLYGPVLCNLSPEVYEVFQITRLDRLFEIRPLN